VDYPLGLDRNLQKHVCQIRTDLDAFESYEVQLLIAHGYGVARAATRPPAFFDEDEWRTVRERTRRPWLPNLPDQPGPAEDRHPVDELNSQTESVDIRVKRRQATWWFTWRPLIWSRRQPVLCLTNIALLLLWIFLLSGASVYVRYRNDIWFADQVRQKYDPWYFRISYRNPNAIWDELVAECPRLKEYQKAPEVEDCRGLIQRAGVEGFPILLAELRSPTDGASPAGGPEGDTLSDQELARLLYHFLRLRANWQTLGYTASDTEPHRPFRRVFQARVQVVVSNGNYYLTGFVEDFFLPEHERAWTQACLDRISGARPPPETAIQFVAQAPVSDVAGPVQAKLTLVQHVSRSDARVQSDLPYWYRPGESLRGAVPHAQLLPQKRIAFAEYTFWPPRK
jgi:hypothetical protein